MKRNHIFEFAGPEIYSFKEFYNFLSKCLNKTRVLVPIPLKIIKIGVSILVKTSFSPLNLEQLKLVEYDNLSSKKYKNLSDLEINAQDLGVIIKKIVKKNV